MQWCLFWWALVYGLSAVKCRHLLFFLRTVFHNLSWKKLWKKLEKMCIYKHAWFVFSYFRVHLAFLDWKVKVETLVLRWGISYDLMNGWKHFTQTEKQIVLLITKLVLMCFYRVLVAPKVPQGSLARQASGWVNSLTSSTRTAVCVCVCVLACLCVCCVVVCTCRLSSVAEKLISTPTNNCLRCA